MKMFTFAVMFNALLAILVGLCVYGAARDAFISGCTGLLAYVMLMVGCWDFIR